jgi:hypothetical protein
VQILRSHVSFLRRRKYHMKTAVGIFYSHAAASRAAEALRAMGIDDEFLNLLVPGETETLLEVVPTREGEQPGMGEALGGVVGGTLGASGGLFAAALVSAVVPGIGPVTAVGLAAAALFGAGGAVTGAVAGGALENALSDGLPKDEIFVYEHALEQGSTVLIALTEDARQHAEALRVLEASGAESLDAARDKWWIGMYDATEEQYLGQAGRPLQDDIEFRRGFDAALQPEVYGKPYDEALLYLQTHYPNTYRHDAFQRGYKHGRIRGEGVGERWRQATLNRKNNA